MITKHCVVFILELEALQHSLVFDKKGEMEGFLVAIAGLQVRDCHTPVVPTVFLIVKYRYGHNLT